MIIGGSINSSVSLLKRSIKELVKLYEILYGKKVCQQIVLLKKKILSFAFKLWSNFHELMSW